ncbi:2'-5' RNA ligase family protein [Mucilaginibacter flavidus]|uniref:2'-5' RNA ligase family protein n=1 Tax=Mucilaginibacter flavidus TaxID=2949309 RepID=UPI002092B220|nr:2'-5' RNA ligase family protein [Mucilaginibacter flavidus]MCO5948538.1 2'-5' RNA ligase family protein [Mucilaginibacter flavidus]
MRLDAASQAFFDKQRARYFPPRLNLLSAHLTLFHQLPDQISTFEVLENLQQSLFNLEVTGLINLGAGVAYKIESPALLALYKLLSRHFNTDLIPQDRQGFRPHVVIMNKETPGKAKNLLNELSQHFEPFTITATGLDLWVYLDGPWAYRRGFDFLNG